MPSLNGRRVAVIAGVRTPFAKAGTVLKDVRAVLRARSNTFAMHSLRESVPVSTAIPEPSTRMSMGQSAEQMAKENHSSRAAQDRWALRSHELAAQGTTDGRLTAEIVPWLPTRSGEAIVQQDNGIRTDTSLEQMAKLKPVFDRRYGSVTAANSSPLNDRDSAVTLVSCGKSHCLRDR